MFWRGIGGIGLVDVGIEGLNGVEDDGLLYTESLRVQRTRSVLKHSILASTREGEAWYSMIRLERHV